METERRPVAATIQDRHARESGHPTSIVACARGWIGTPYVHQASLKGAGCDCLGLLRGVWRELTGEDGEQLPAYSFDWAEASGVESLRAALLRYADSIARENIAPGDIALFRMRPRGPAKHCAIVARGADTLTLIHSRQNKRVSEEPFTRFWRSHLAFAFRV